jgi:hypothetical protein
LNRASRAGINGPDGCLSGRCEQEHGSADLHGLRQIIAEKSEDATPLFGEIEVDESYFGSHRKGKRGSGAARKVRACGPRKRGVKVYAPRRSAK